ncbi:hypothetical protein [uncultured Luteimonas sp.]|uniref:hypothetical protein n=1 Tax=uncultured Luteimonas sp. TaxID=453144 RepID=UPI00261BAE97|nr:hypothetical protein [uncultured Luteimonas sp.]
MSQGVPADKWSLQDTAGLLTDGLRNTAADDPANPKLQQYMRDALPVLSTATQISGERTRALYWYRNTPIPEFEHRTAEQLVSEGKADAVLS